MNAVSEYRYLIKFVLTSAACLFLGATHGMIQVLPPVRAWLDAVGSPITGPGRMIDPLAHAHLAVIGGVIIFMMGSMYYLMSKVTGRRPYSQRLVEHSYWWTTLGLVATYGSFMYFGIVEGNLMLTDPAGIPAVHQYYGPILSVAGTAMSFGFLVFFINLVMTLRQKG